MVTEQNKKKKKVEIGSSFLVHYSWAPRHTVMTPGPGAGSGGKGRGKEVRMVRQHNLISLCHPPPPPVDRATE